MEMMDCCNDLIKKKKLLMSSKIWFLDIELDDFALTQ